MQVERVQKWVISALVLTTAGHFAAGLVILANTVDRPGAFPVLLARRHRGLPAGDRRACGSSTSVSIVTPWLVFAALPVAVGFWFA